MRILGIQDGHNASVALLEDGELRFAIQEERLVRVKNAGGFPKRAIEETMSACGLNLADVYEFAFAGRSSWNELNSVPDVLRKYDRAFTPLGRYPENQANGRRVLRAAIKSVIPEPWLKSRGTRKTAASIAKHQKERLAPLVEIGGDAGRAHFVDHHTCHAASAAYGSGMTQPIAVVTADASGDGLCGTISRFEDSRLVRRAVITADNSIARLYSLTTYYLGMVPMEHEYKLMGMAPFASHSTQAREIANSFHELFEWNNDGLTYRRREHCPPVPALGPWLIERYRFERFDNISAGLQLFIEEFATEWVRRILQTLGVRRIAVAGGLFMNVKLNQAISELAEVDDIFVFPSCGDESNVFGAVYSRYHDLSGNVPAPLRDYYLGSSFSDPEIEAALKSHDFIKAGVSWRKLDDIEGKVAELLSQGQIVARFAGKEEFGARALGNRSILAPAGDSRAVATINHMIKKRDFWMPFAPSCSEPERYLHNPKGLFSPYMMLTFTALQEQEDRLVATVQEMDKTARVHHVVKEQNPSYHRLLDEYNARVGDSVILNTSFNLHGYPLVHSPEDALSVFDRSGIRYLAIGSYLVTMER